ncbi:DUF6207 family protein [Streptomyces sp. NPDC093149]|uniref:DUF6207 family protein n=1 Tax=Streptomyces sp. NPDC093149 TaxID=3366031 RepID=UPI00382D53C1
MDPINEVHVKEPGLVVIDVAAACGVPGQMGSPVRSPTLAVTQIVLGPGDRRTPGLLQAGGNQRCSFLRRAGRHRPGACLTGRVMQTVPTPRAAIAPRSAPPSQSAAKALGGPDQRPRSRQPCHQNGAA